MRKGWHLFAFSTPPALHQLHRTHRTVLNLRSLENKSRMLKATWGIPVVLVVISGGPVDLADYAQMDGIHSILWLGCPCRLFMFFLCRESVFITVHSLMQHGCMCPEPLTIRGYSGEAAGEALGRPTPTVLHQIDFKSQCRSCRLVYGLASPSGRLSQTFYRAFAGIASRGLHGQFACNEKVLI